MRIGLKLILGFIVLASLVGLVGLLSWTTNHEIGLQIENLRRSSIIGFVDASEMAIALHNGHAASHELLDARRAQLSEPETNPQLQQKIDKSSQEIGASLSAFKRSLERSRQANQSIILWRKEHPTLEAAPSKPASNQKLLSDLQRTFRRHEELSDEFVTLCRNDPNAAQAFLENTVEYQVNQEMLPLIRSYGGNATAEFTTGIRNVEQRLHSVNHRNVIFTLTACLGAGLLGFVISRSISSPLKALKAAALRIGKGDFDVEIPAKSRDEVGVLGQAFRQMVSDLKSTMVSRAYVDSIVRSMSEMLVVVDHDGRIQKVNPAVLRQLNVQEDRIVGQPLEMIWRQSGEYLHDGATITGALRAGVETEFSDQQGASVHVQVSAAELQDEQGHRQGIVLTATDIEDRKRAEQQLRDSLREKDVLLKEVHHRVKNNLQVISSLLTMQAKRATDPAAVQVCKDSQRRIRAMALIHEQLYQSDDVSQISFRDYVDQLIRQLRNTFSAPDERVHIHPHICDAMLDLDLTIPCGMIVNELVTNAIEHAFPDDRSGRIDIEFEDDGSRYRLTVRDDGVGLPPNFDPRQANSLGLRVVDLLTKQLRGTLTFNGERGAAVSVLFSKGN